MSCALRDQCESWMDWMRGGSGGQGVHRRWFWQRGDRTGQGRGRVTGVTGLAWDPCSRERAFRTGFLESDWARAESPGWSQEAGRLGLLGLRCRCTMYMSVARAHGNSAWVWSWGYRTGCHWSWLICSLSLNFFMVKKLSSSFEGFNRSHSLTLRSFS